MTFAGVISRDGGVPWGDTTMTSQKWLNVHVERVRIADLIATQVGVHFQHLIDESAPFTGDPFPHVVVWQGKKYLEDGHHRVTRSALAGETEVLARVLLVGARS